MIDRARLLAGCKSLVRQLIDDLRLNSGDGREVGDVVDREYQRASVAGRTALSKVEWAEGLYAQVAVAWVLGAVFVRFCEDNGLLPEPLLSGSGSRRAIALDHRSAYLQTNPAHDDRQWLREVFTRYRALPATGEVFGDQNPIWLLSPSADGARQLVQYFQAVDPDAGDLAHDFTDATWSTRFLGDLYQDLSEHAKKIFALLQTPVFVEEFILDYTFEPAIATFGLREITAIDPTCGSGHFLLGLFTRLFDQWSEAEPGTNRRELAQRSLDAIGGVDLNPFAVSIARFRLLLAALRAGGDARLADAPGYQVHVAVGDSLLHGDPPGRLAGMTPSDDLAGAAAHGYATEDVDAARVLLSRSWHVVVGNPPYITVKDPALNALYRTRFTTCRGKYSLGVPFLERFYQLARQDGNPERAGYVGMITANSFMKREMGKHLIEQWFPSHDVTHIVDTSLAEIPGHNQTAILFGRSRFPTSSKVRAVLGIKGDSTEPDDPREGGAWRSIVNLIDAVGSSDDYVSVVDFDRSHLALHPWSIGGGGAMELKETLDRVGSRLENYLSATPGFMAICGYDELASSNPGTLRRYQVEPVGIRELVRGEDVRDWSIMTERECFFPYEGTRLLTEKDLPQSAKRFWRVRSNLWNRPTFSGATYRQDGRHWWQWHQVSTSRLASELFLSFANVASHNHFVLCRTGRLHNPHAAIITLREGNDVEEYFGVLGVLNSSTVCFWMKQVSFKKSSAHGGGSTDQPFTHIYEFDGSKLRQVPMPPWRPALLPRTLDTLGRTLVSVSPGSIATTAAPTYALLETAKSRNDEIRAKMIACQERLDWEVYRLYGLVDEDVTTGQEEEPPLKQGERAFEIVLARTIAGGEGETAWFAQYGSTPVLDLPEHWSDTYKRVVDRRIQLIETDLNIGIIERPEYKRRWVNEPWDEQVRIALRRWLLDRLESARYWPEPAAITTTARMAAQARTDSEFMQVARIYEGRDDVDVAPLVADLVKSEAVPYLAALRYTEAGVRKHAQWLDTWDFQRREDADEHVAFPLPPSYARGDFTPGVWEHRGKLDVPKEQFISYPGAASETDASLPVGWAGWDHLARARALATWYLQARRDGRDTAHLKPLLAGLVELVPWLKQWYDEPNADPALHRPGSQIAALVDAELRALHLTPHDVVNWRPEPARRGRRARG